MRCGVVRGADREVYSRAERLGLLEGTPLYPYTAVSLSLQYVVPLRYVEGEWGQQENLVAWYNVARVLGNLERKSPRTRRLGECHRDSDRDGHRDRDSDGHRHRDF